MSQADHQAVQVSEKAVPYREHSGENASYLRDTIMGVNDGLVSMFLLIVGITGGGLSSHGILLAGITGSIAGAISMALGEMMATKSQNELLSGDLKLEKEHFKYHRDKEVAEVREFLNEELKLKDELLQRVTDAVCESDEAMMKLMMAFEFGAAELNTRSPMRAMAFSGSLFISGSLPTWLPFAFTSDIQIALICSAVLSCLALIAVGMFKTRATMGDPIKGGAENLIVGVAGALISYGIGLAYEAHFGQQLLV